MDDSFRVHDHLTNKNPKSAVIVGAGNAQFAGSLGTQVVKVFELAIARTGLRDEEARKAGFDPLTVQSAFWDHKAYYPGAQEIVFRICGDKSTGRLLGAQLIGHWKSEISKRVDIFATALFHNMMVENLNELDLSYTPPLSGPWDPVQMATQAWCRSLNNSAT
jgi:NADPH-dependent 2,4-dienoyl-CoA reductase/sulfur reductase-like enzyme